MALPLSAWDTLLIPIIPSCQMLKHGAVYWIKSKQWQPTLNLKCIFDVEINFNGKKGCPSALFPQP